MRRLSPTISFNRWAIVAAAALVALMFVVFIAARSVFAVSGDDVNAGKKFVTIHDRGKDIGILTDARTVGEALRDGGIAVDEKDLVEPAVDEELVAKSYDVNIYRARPVVVIDGATTQKILSPYQTSKQIAKDAGIILHDEDITTVEPISDVAAHGTGIQVTIDRATPFTLVLYGKKMVAYSQEQTVGAVLQSKGITLAKNDTISVDKESRLHRGMLIEIWRNGKQIVTVEEAIARPIEEIRDADRPISYKLVKTPGKDGKKQVTYEIEMRNGKEIARKLITSITTLKPVKEVVIIGVKSTSPTENEAIAWKYLLGQGFSRNQAAGIMGNLMQEHGFRTDGDGLAQWTGGRRAELLSRQDPYSIYTQLDFLMHELNGKYSYVKNAIRGTSAIEQSVRIFQDQYERCGICAESKRITYAYEILGRH